MAERGRPVSEHFPPGASPQTESRIVPEPQSVSKSSTEMVTSPTQLDKANQGSKGGNGSLPMDTQNGGKPTLRVGAHSADSTPDHPAVRNVGRPHSMAEPHPHHGIETLPLLEGELNHLQHYGAPCCGGERGGMGSSCSHRDLSGQRLAPASIPVQRSHSDTLQTLLCENPISHPHPQPHPHPHPHCDAAAVASPAHLAHLAHDAHYHVQKPCPSLVCKQALQMQQSGSFTTTSARVPSPTPLSQPGCVPAAPSNTPCEGATEARHPHYEEVVCCGSYGVALAPGALEETLAAYCHHPPIPSAVQLLPPQSRGLPGAAEVQMLALPRLISSISETGLDAKRMLRCCNMDCTWPNAPSLQHAGSQPHIADDGRGIVVATAVATAVTRRDAGTMTSRTELRDVGVQAEQVGETPPPPHMYPEVCLADNGANGAPLAAGKAAAQSKSPVKEVKWDAEGMTWEVYGASVDPEELGLAIQKHLELQIKETANRAAKLSRQNTSLSQGTAGTGSESASCRRKRRGLMGSLRSLRGPGCCTRTTTAVD